MNESKLTLIINNWRSQLPISTKYTSYSELMHLYNNIQSNIPGNILIIDHSLDKIIMAILLIKHFSRCKRLVITNKLNKKHRQLIEKIGLSHLLIVTKNITSYSYIQIEDSSQNNISSNCQLHPILYSKTKQMIPTIGINDEEYLIKSLNNQWKDKDSIHVIYIGSNTHQTCFDIHNAITKNHPNCRISSAYLDIILHPYINKEKPKDVSTLCIISKAFGKTFANHIKKNKVDAIIIDHDFPKNIDNTLISIIHLLLKEKPLLILNNAMLSMYPQLIKNHSDCFSNPSLYKQIQTNALIHKINESVSLVPPPKLTYPNCFCTNDETNYIIANTHFNVCIMTTKETEINQ